VLDENRTRHLNGVHTVFGKVSKGIDVVQKIQKDDDELRSRRLDPPLFTWPRRCPSTLKTKAAFIGLIVTAVLLFTMSFTIVKLTNAKFARHKAEAKAAETK
jgi:hypothetical protein